MYGATRACVFISWRMDLRLRRTGFRVCSCLSCVSDKIVTRALACDSKGRSVLWFNIFITPIRMHTPIDYWALAY